MARGMALAGVVLALTLGSVWWLTPAGAAMPFMLRIQWALRIALIPIAWLVAAVANVARQRFFSQVDIAGSSRGGASPAVAEAGAVLQNSLEQVVLAIATYLIVAASVPRPVLLTVALATLFSIGRLAFWIGYARGAAGRAFGFALTFYPTVAALVIVALFLLLGWSA